jgi:hypothetical protein
MNGDGSKCIMKGWCFVFQQIFHNNPINWSQENNEISIKLQVFIDTLNALNINENENCWLNIFFTMTLTLLKSSI